ncbi:DISARM system helicase DrmA [Kineococcus sp. NPDC059986]|uniref:DISARM system helicase DrmA n=1 Tax=Kineococcus sp. NPDC059986 TaxID=3155538 RepID=UPI00344D1995
MTNDVTSFQVRAELEDLLERDLLGPWDGPEEELPPHDTPAERYLLGRLVPRRAVGTGTRVELPEGEDVDSEATATAARALEDDPSLADVENIGTSGDSDVHTEAPAQQRARSMAASSLGLSFRVPRSTTRLTVTASWGQYEKGDSTQHESEQGRPRKVWHRRPRSAALEVDLTREGKHDPRPVLPDVERVVLTATVQGDDGCLVVDLALVNDQGEDHVHDDAFVLYQTALQVTALDSTSAIFVGHNDPIIPRTANDDMEREHLALLHRRTRKYATGRLCAVDADVRDGEDRAWRLSTTCFPAADVKLTVPAGAKQLPGVVLDMARLGSSDLATDQLITALRPLATQYRAWLAGKRKVDLQEPDVAAYADAALLALERADELCGRLDRAIDFLRDNPVAREAFRFANQAMAAQRIRSELVRIRTTKPERSAAQVLHDIDIEENRSWRPFQLAFVLLCLPGLTDPGHPDAHRGPGEEGEVALLFFPTGGGKTEAYLGLTAYTLAIRRLQGTVGSGPETRSGSDGVAVLMRYTLRLLTAQQFQRAAALICACEQLRLERAAAGDRRWDGSPFRIGLWVGSSVTPNTFEDAKQQVEDKKDKENPAGGPLQLVVCPWCGERLTAASLRTDGLRRRVLLHCSDPDGRCEFTPARSAEGLPVLTVDEEIYRLTPSLIIGTVDKFAQLPWKAATTTLFGRATQRCERHGWMTPDSQAYCTGRHTAAGGLPRTEPSTVLPVRPPDLIIQDELHLIADALGSMVGLYETAIDHLATRQVEGMPVRPVVVASTATVRRAHQQVRQVFDRSLAIFPPQVIDAGETFFSTVEPPSPDTPSRRYRGICASGERLKAVEIRVASALMEHAQELFDRCGDAADPYMTLVDYFTSTRELAGMRRLVEDDITDRLASRRVRTNRRRPTIAELTSRMPSSKISSTLADLETPYDRKHDTTDAFRRQMLNRDAGQDAKRESGFPTDVLLATSMLQVGVDVQRLGLMVVTGQPKNTAEYIQASSRVGRDRRRPGLVVTIYQWTRPRDLAHYESFAYDHATFGMNVEGLTTTPFSNRAVDRGLSAVLTTMLRHDDPSALPNTGAQVADVSSSTAERLIRVIAQRAGRVSGEQKTISDVADGIRKRLDEWSTKRTKLKSGVLGYSDEPDVTGLLRKPADEEWTTWTAPMSLRGVEDEVLLQIKRPKQSGDEPDWSYAGPDGGQQ